MQSCWNRSRVLALFTVIAAGVLAAQLRPLPGTEQARQAFLQQFAAAALDRTQHSVRYDPAYVRLPIPAETCLPIPEFARTR